MKRDFIIKGWSKAANRFLNFDEFLIDPNGMPVCFDIETGEIAILMDVIPVFNIGKKTKDGEEIFCGDIFKGLNQFENSDEFPLMVIAWDEYACNYIAKQLNGGKYTVPLSWINNAERIGNIYENSNLLKQ